MCDLLRLLENLAVVQRRLQELSTCLHIKVRNSSNQDHQLEYPINGEGVSKIVVLGRRALKLSRVCYKWGLVRCRSSFPSQQNFLFA